MNKPTERIRGWKGQLIRKNHLRKHPLCAACERNGKVAVAQEVDHVIPLHLGGAERDSNRESLCKPCHLAKTARDLGYKQRPRIGIDGYPVVDK